MSIDCVSAARRLVRNCASITTLIVSRGAATPTLSSDPFDTFLPSSPRYAKSSFAGEEAKAPGSAFSGPGMRLLVHFLQAGDAHMSVDLGRGQIHVAQKLLD